MTSAGTGPGRRTTRWGTLFRSDTLHELTPGRRRTAAVPGPGHHHRPAYVRASSSGPAGDHSAAEPMAFHHLSCDPATGRGEAMAAPAPAGEDLAERYLWYLDDRPAVPGRGARAGGRTDPATPGVPLRGRQGPDRGAGRPGARHPGRGRRGDRGRLRHHGRTHGDDPRPLPFRPRFAERMATVPASRFSVEAETMVRFLDEAR